MLRTVMFVDNWGSYRARDVAELSASLAEALVGAGVAVAVASTGSATGEDAVGEDDVQAADAQPVGDAPSLQAVVAVGEGSRRRSRKAVVV